MEAIAQDTQRQGSRFRKAAGKVRWIIKEIIVATIKYTSLSIIVILVFLGGMTIYDITIGDDVPPVRYIGGRSPYKLRAYLNSTRHLVGRKPTDEECWLAVQPSLQILEQVCPEAYAWVKDRHANDKLIWDRTPRSPYLAKYDYQSKELTFHVQTFTENDGLKASIFAHEFRHSRQNFTKFFKSVVACMVCRKYKPSIVESDAELFEKEVLIAIFL